LSNDDPEREGLDRALPVDPGSRVCISEPTPELVAALRKQFPNLDEKDIQVFDDRQLAEISIFLSSGCF
jgi:hypothetical protein